MLSDLFIIGLIGGVVAVDTTEMGQFMISLPIFSSVLLGYLLNNIEVGVYMGVLMVLPWLKLIPAGGAIYHHGNIGSLTATATSILVLKNYLSSIDTIIFLSVIYGIILSYLAGKLIHLKRKLNEKIVIHNILDIKNGKINRTNLWVFASITITYFSGAIYSIIGSLLGYNIFKSIPEKFLMGLSIYSIYGIVSFLGVGFGIVLSMFFQKKYFYFVIIGAISGFILLIFL